jgi:hypothetical protein
MFDDGTTKDLLLLGDMTLSKDVIVKALWQSQQSGVWVVKRKGLCPLPCCQLQHFAWQGREG